MSGARVPGRQAASVPGTVCSIRTVAVRREDRSRLRQGLTLGTGTSLVDGTLGDVEGLDHALIVAVGGVIATDVLAAGFLDDVGIGQAGSALVMGVERSSEEALGDARWSALTVAV